MDRLAAEDGRHFRDHSGLGLRPLGELALEDDCSKGQEGTSRASMFWQQRQGYRSGAAAAAQTALAHGSLHSQQPQLHEAPNHHHQTRNPTQQGKLGTAATNATDAAAHWQQPGPQHGTQQEAPGPKNHKNTQKERNQEK